MNNIQKAFAAKSKLRRPMRHGMSGGEVDGPKGIDNVQKVDLTDGEYVLPADTTAAIGVDVLDALKDATHEPVDRPKIPGRLRGMVDGGFVRNPRERLQDFNRGQQARQGMTDRTRTAPGPSPAAAQPPTVMNATAPPTNNRSLLRNAGRVLKATPGVGMGAYSAVGDVNAMANEGVGLVNTADMGAGVGLAGTFLKRTNPLVGAGSMGWLAGRSIGENLPDDVNDTIGRTVNQAVDGTGNLINKGLRWGGLDTNYGQNWGVDDTALLKNRESGRVRDAALDASLAGGSNPAAVTANDPAIGPEQVPVTLDGATGQPITAEQDPLAYRRSRLAEFGVPESVQDGPITTDPTTLRDSATPTGEFQNFGDYGGNAPIYGRRTGEGEFEFTGVGDMARPGDAPVGEDPMMTRLRSQMRVEDTNATTEVMRQNRLREMGLADRGDENFYLNREAEQAAERDGLRTGGSGSRGSNEPELSPSERTMAMMAAQNEQTATGIEARAKVMEAEQKAVEAAAKAQANELKQTNASSKDAQSAINSAIDLYSQGDSDRAVSLNKFYSTLPVDIRQGLEALPATDQQALLTNIFDIYEAQNEGLIGGKDAGATFQNTGIMAALGAGLPRLFGKFAAPVGDAAITAGTRGRVRNLLRNMSARSGAGAVVGGATGAAITPDAGNTERWEDLVLDPVTGQPQVAEFSLPDAFRYGLYDSIDGPMSDDYRTTSGRRVNAEAYNDDDTTQAVQEVEALRRRIRQNGLR